MHIRPIIAAFGLFYSYTCPLLREYHLPLPPSPHFHAACHDDLIKFYRLSFMIYDIFAISQCVEKARLVLHRHQKEGSTHPDPALSLSLSLVFDHCP